MTQSTILELSLLVLCTVLTIEWFVLRALVNEVRRCQDLVPASTRTSVDQREAQLGQLVPSFSAELYPNGANLTASDLRGKSHMLLFLSVAEVEAETSNSLVAMVFYLIGKVEGYVYVFVDGEHRNARWLDERFSLTAAFGERLQYVLDRDRQLADRLAVHSTPSAVLIDEGGYVKKVGWPDPHSSKTVASAPPVELQAASVG